MMGSSLPRPHSLFSPRAASQQVDICGQTWKPVCDARHENSQCTGNPKPLPCRSFRCLWRAHWKNLLHRFKINFFRYCSIHGVGVINKEQGTKVAGDLRPSSPALIGFNLPPNERHLMHAAHYNTLHQVSHLVLQLYYSFLNQLPHHDHSLDHKIRSHVESFRDGIEEDFFDIRAMWNISRSVIWKG